MMQHNTFEMEEIWLGLVFCCLLVQESTDSMWMFCCNGVIIGWRLLPGMAVFLKEQKLLTSYLHVIPATKN